MIFDNFSKNGFYITEADDDEDNYDIKDDDDQGGNDGTASADDNGDNSDSPDNSADNNADGDDEDNYDIQDDDRGDNTQDNNDDNSDDSQNDEDQQNQDDQNNDDSQGDDQNGGDQDGDDEDNYDINDDDQGGDDSSGGSPDDQGNDNGEDSGSDDSGDDGADSDDPRAKLQALEKSIFDQLSPEQQQAKVKELKDLFITAHEKCQEVINMVSNSGKDPQQAKIYDYIVSRLTDLKTYITDYMKDIFDSKTYLENMTEFQKYLTVFDTIKNIFNEINKDSQSK